MKDSTRWLVLLGALAGGVVLQRVAKTEAAALGLSMFELACVTCVVGSAVQRRLR